MADILTTSLSLLAGTPSECAAFLNSPIPVVFPAHPRTENRLREFGLYDRLAQASHVQLMPPVSYLDMLVLPKNCVLVMTDSGGLQEEATVPCIRKPVLMPRASTERPEAMRPGSLSSLELALRAY